MSVQNNVNLPLLPAAERTTIFGLVAIGLMAALNGCGPPSTGKDSDAHRVESFEFDEKALEVANDYADVKVDHGKPGSITVREYRTAFGTAPDEPEWTLEQGTLDLGKPCASTVGICQVSYRITVPKGTEVDPLKTVGSES